MSGTLFGGVALAQAGVTPEDVMRDTWGHMDAEPGRKYPGVILFAGDHFGNDQIILRSDFGGEAGYGPWFYEGIHAWLCDQETEPGQVYQWQGWYRLCKNGNHQFVGKIRKVEV